MALKFSRDLYFAIFSFLNYSRVHEFARKCSIKSNSYLNIGVFIIGKNFEFARQGIREY